MADYPKMSIVTIAGQTFEIADETARDFKITSEHDGDGNVTIVGGTSAGTGGGGTTVTSYLQLQDKPTIEGVTLKGDKMLEDFNLKSITNTALEAMLKED